MDLAASLLVSLALEGGKRITQQLWLSVPFGIFPIATTTWFISSLDFIENLLSSRASVSWAPHKKPAQTGWLNPNELLQVLGQEVPDQGGGGWVPPEGSLLSLWTWVFIFLERWVCVSCVHV